jgi:phage regulator Rha-like protein
MTMSSREIAELTGKEHKNVLADIRNMLEKLGKRLADFSADLPDAYGRMQPGFKLDRELTLTLVSGYDIPLRHRVVTRLAEHEAKKPQPLIPQTLHEALRLAADLAEQRNAAQDALAIALPKAEANDRLSDSSGSMDLTDTAKHLRSLAVAHWRHIATQKTAIILSNQ